MLVIQIVEAQDEFTGKDPAPTGWGRGNMKELVGELASKAGSGVAVAAKSIGIIAGFFPNEGHSGTVQALIGKIPGAEAASAAAASSAGRAGPIADRPMEAGTRLTTPGLSIGEIQNIGRELFRFGRDKIGADHVGEIIAGTPGLSQFA